MSLRKEYAVTITARERAELLPLDSETGAVGAREVAGRTLVTLISPGTELAGNYQGSSFPSIPGYAAVFAVEEVGAEVSDIKAGDRVFCMGQHRSHQRCLRDDLVPIPDRVPPEVAVFCRMMGITMSTLTTTTARPPEQVLVTGLGLVGHLAAKIFASCGYEVTACDPSSPRREIAARSGISRVLPAAPVDDPQSTGRFGLVLECSGHEQAALDGCRVVKKRGEVVLVGTPWRRQTELFAHELLRAVFHNYVVLRSGWEWELPVHPTDFRVNSLFGNFAAALRWLGEGRIRVDGVYEFAPPREAQRIYQGLLHHSSNRLSAVFDWSDCP